MKCAAVDRRLAAFHEKSISPLGIALRVSYDGEDGPLGHPDLKGFGKRWSVFWSRARRTGERRDESQQPFSVLEL
jgi:hypothetical protein